MKASTDLFRGKVRKLFTDRCLGCHGGESLEGGFNLASRELLLKGGDSGAAIIPGRKADSLLFRMVAHTQKPGMPYDEEKLAAAEIEAIGTWIELGAAYDQPLVDGDVELKDWTERIVQDSARDYWAFRPLSGTQPPDRTDSWCRTPIDHFVLDQLEENGLRPSREASRRVLIRRAWFGLTGLPPTAQDVKRVLSDQSENWYERMLDELLESPHFGERQARRWLDIARFAESHGFEQDYNREHAYHYRDFVIQAFNQDLPYDEFVRWQLAGDEIEPENPLALMATGFLGAGVFPTQLTEREFEPARYDELDDMVSTIGTSMLGLTIGCARCHDHKFDPIPAADYYRLISTFGQTIRSHAEVDLNPQQTRERLRQWESERDPLVTQLNDYERDVLPERFRQWVAAGTPEPDTSPAWMVLHVDKAVSKGGATLTALPDESILASGTNPDFDTYTFTATTNLKEIHALRLQTLSHESLVRGGPGRAGNGNMGLGTISVVASPVAGTEQPIAVELTAPRATFEQNSGNLSIAASIDRTARTGWAVDPQFGKDHAAAFQFREPVVGFSGGTRLTITMVFDVNNRHNIGRARLSVTGSARELPLDAAEKPQGLTDLLALLESGASLDDADQRDRLLRLFAPLDRGWNTIRAKVTAHESRRPTPKKTTILVCTEGLKPLKHHADGRGFPHFYKETFFLKRGDATQKVRPATAGLLQVLNAGSGDRWTQFDPVNHRTSQKRRAFANWLTDVEHGGGSLLARVIVNRLWQYHLGQGIVTTPNDFGKQGAPPTHPELLDWLAGQLIESGWRLKPIHRLIMSSSVYRQTSEPDETADRDQTKRLFGRFQTRRLEAEEIRDAMLAVSGELDRTQFGPGTLNAAHKRRSIYFMIKRSKLIPMMQIFDAPEPLVSVGARPSTTIASQALMFMNSPHVREYALAFARRVTSEDPRDSIRRAYWNALSRGPSEDESSAAVEFIEQQRSSYVEDGRNPAEAEVLALADFCQTIFCLNEFVFLD